MSELPLRFYSLALAHQSHSCLAAHGRRSLWQCIVGLQSLQRSNMHCSLNMLSTGACFPSVQGKASPHAVAWVQ